MNLPLDTPQWVAAFLKTVEDKAEQQVGDSRTSDQAMKASGAYALWLSIKAEVELEADKQNRHIREQREALHARSAS